MERTVTIRTELDADLVEQAPAMARMLEMGLFRAREPGEPAEVADRADRDLPRPSAAPWRGWPVG